MSILTPFTAIPAPDGSAADALVLCDHAGRAVPERLANLGLAADVFERHIAYDIGAAGVARTLAAELGVPALLANFSRLLIDSNRGPDDPTLVMRLSDGAIIPGNADVDDEEVARRRADWWEPYHRAISDEIDGELASGRTPVLLSIHSFTPAWKGVPRPWHVGILWDRDDRLARPLLRALEAEGDLTVGDNEPYDGALVGDTMYRHGTERGLAHALIEVRQDLIATPAGQDEWGRRLARLLRPILADPQLHKIVHFGSRAG